MRYTAVRTLEELKKEISGIREFIDNLSGEEKEYRKKMEREIKIRSLAINDPFNEYEQYILFCKQGVTEKIAGVGKSWVI